MLAARIDSRFETPGLLGDVEAHVAVGVGDRAAELALDDVGRVEHHHRALRRLDGLRHLVGRLLEVHHPGAGARDRGLGHDERVAVARVEPDRDVAGELDVLALIVAHRHAVGVVEEDVGRHQGRVGEQARGDELAGLAADLSLNCVMRCSSPIDAVHSRSQASRACSGTWLCTNSVQTSGSSPQATSIVAIVERLVPQLGGVVGEREGVEVDDAVVGLVLVLVDRPVPDRAQVVADVGLTARLDAREHDRHGPED